MTATATVIDFLRVLYAIAPAGSYCEMRAFHPSYFARQFWSVPIDETNVDPLGLGFTLETACGLRWAEMHSAAGAHVYFGVNPRWTRAGGKTEHTLGYVAFAVELDGKKEDPDVSLARLEAAGIRPGIVVRSGSGRHAHAYVLLDRPVPLPPVVPGRRRENKGHHVARRLCRWALSDPVFDLARILRLPETQNAKPGGSKATIERLEGERRYTVEGGRGPARRGRGGHPGR